MLQNVLLVLFINVTHQRSLTCHYLSACNHDDYPEDTNHEDKETTVSSLFTEKCIHIENNEDNVVCNNGNLKSAILAGSSIERKEAIEKVMTSTMFNILSFSYLFELLDNEDRRAEALPIGKDTPLDGPILGREALLSSMRYEKILGEGAFKKVYSVTFSRSNYDHQEEAKAENDYNYRQQSKSLAMAVERLRSKSEARDEIRGIRVAEHIQQMLLQNSPDESRYFESIEDWWIQTSPPARFDVGRYVFGEDTKNIPIEKTRRKPTSFIGKNWYLFSFKPVYDMDLKRFSKLNTLMYPILQEQSKNSVRSGSTAVGGISLNSTGALNLIYELCHAGRILHDNLGIIHRDIKPKNIMLKNGQVVIIDFGFAGAGTSLREEGLEGSKFCITEIGKIKGELNYVIAEDVQKYRGCKEGDTFAMGRTIYEVFFEPSLESSNSIPKEITFEHAMAENERFLSQIDGALSTCRFQITAFECEKILTLVKGLCRSQMSFREAEKFIEDMLSVNNIWRQI